MMMSASQIQDYDSTDNFQDRQLQPQQRGGVPANAKAILFLVLVLAALSTRSLHPTLRAYCERQLNSPSISPQHRRSSSFPMTTTSSDGRSTLRFGILGYKKHHHHHPARVVFYDSKPWSLGDDEDGLFSSDYNGTTRKMHPVQLRRRPSTAAVPDHTTTDNVSDATDDDDDNEFMDDTTRFYPVGDSQDDFPNMERRLWPQHEFDPHCKPSAKWQSTFYPVCNEIHAVADLRQGLVSQDLSLLSSKGFWRHAWRHQLGGVNATSSTDPLATTVWKTFKINHNFEEKFYEDNRVDAVAMERLTGSPYIINIYGFCGLTVVQEFAGRELAHVVDAGQLDSTQKLKLAKKITQGVADIHSIPGDDGTSDGTQSLVHNDLNLANLVFTADDRPVLNDFNIAILLMKHNETGETCPFYSHFPNPQWKAPEEQVDSDKESDEHPPIVNEKIDIYALGNVLYRMAVGGSPWKRPEAKKLYPDEKLVVARLKRCNGTLPTIPDEILGNATESNDPGLAYLLEAMRLCYSFNPKDRPTATALVDILDDAIQKTVSWEEKGRAIAARSE